jgi:rsbT antagonist protein RsbS
MTAMTDPISTTRLPVIKLWGQVLVPLQGDLNDAVAERLREQVLETIRTSDAEGLIIDVTGIWMVDSHLCAVLSNMAGSARIMGTECVICGMSAEIALTLQAMDIDMSWIRTALTLEEAFAALGIRPASKKKAKKPVLEDLEESDQDPFGLLR